MLTRLPLACFVALAIADHAATQSPDIWRTIGLSSLMPQDQLASNTVAGNFSGHDHQDIAYLLNGKVVLVVAPCIHKAAMPIAIDLEDPADPGVPLFVHGLAITPRGGDLGSEGLALATANGLYHWSLTSAGTASYALIAPGEWHSVVCGDLDGGVGARDFVGAGSAARDCLRVCLRGASTTHSVLPFSGETISSIAVLQWNGTAPEEVCVSTNTRLWIGTPTQMLTQTVLANDGTGLLTKIHVPNGDNLAWMVTAGGQCQLRVMTRSAQLIFDATSIGNVRHMCAGDFNDDGRDDLLLTQQNATSMRLLIGDPAATNLAQFTPAAAIVVNPFDGVYPGSYTFSGAWLGDLDGDGLGDYVAPMRAIDQNNFATSSVLVHQQRVGGAPSELRPSTLTFDIDVTSFGNLARYTLTLATTEQPPELADATHLELLLFAATSDTTTGLVLVPEGLQRVRVPVAIASPAPDAISFDVPLTSLDNTAYAGAVRWIRVVSNVTQTAWPPALFAVGVGDMESAVAAWVVHSQNVVPTLTQLIHPGVPDGDKEPPNLPPPPTDPPRPPTPPPPPPPPGG